jgi:hypothetical protein
MTEICPVNGNGADRLPEIGAAGDFQNVMGAFVAGDPVDGLDPVFGAAVDAMISAKRFGAFKFVVAAGGDDDIGAMRLGDL